MDNNKGEENQNSYASQTQITDFLARFNAADQGKNDQDDQNTPNIQSAYQQNQQHTQEVRVISDLNSSPSPVSGSLRQQQQIQSNPGCHPAQRSTILQSSNPPPSQLWGYQQQGPCNRSSSQPLPPVPGALSQSGHEHPPAGEALSSPPALVVPAKSSEREALQASANIFVQHLDRWCTYVLAENERLRVEVASLKADQDNVKSRLQKLETELILKSSDWEHSTVKRARRKSARKTMLTKAPVYYQGQNGDDKIQEGSSRENSHMTTNILSKSNTRTVESSSFDPAVRNSTYPSQWLQTSFGSQSGNSLTHGNVFGQGTREIVNAVIIDLDEPNAQAERGQDDGACRKC